MKVNYELYGLNWSDEEKKEHKILMDIYEDTSKEVGAYVRTKSNVPAHIKAKNIDAYSALSLFLNKKRIPSLVKNKHSIRSLNIITYKQPPHCEPYPL